MPYAKELKESVLTDDEELNQLVDQALSLLERTDSAFVKAEFETIEMRNSVERKLRHILRKLGESPNLKISTPPSTPVLEIRRREKLSGVKTIKLMEENTTK